MYSQSMIDNQDTQVNETVAEQRDPSETLSKRGRPRVEIKWPEGSFTFVSLASENILSNSSLRKKMRVELQQGGLVKVDTLKTAFGRPLNVYKKM